MDPIITLLSDFGSQDTYVAEMKGVLLQRCAHARMVDLTHAIPPQDLWAARFHLQRACGHFPPGTVHLAVVDPGVGGQRRGIALQYPGGYLVGPDNGIFSGVLQDSAPLHGVELTNPDYWYAARPSRTFHGRDIFAPAVAHLALGHPINALGRKLDLDTLVSLPVPPAERSASRLRGTLQHVDHFGNLITTLPGEWLQDYPWQAVLSGQKITGVLTYGDVPLGELAAYIGSHGWVEIGVNGSSAWERLRPRIGDPVEVRL